MGLNTPLRTRSAWVVLRLGVIHALAPLGNTWCLGHSAESKGNESGVRTHNQWVLRKDPILLGSSSKPKVPGSYESKYYCC